MNNRFLLFAPIAIQLFVAPSLLSNEMHDKKFFFEFRPGAWIFQEQKLRNIYAKGIFTFQTDLGWHCADRFDVGISGQYLTRCGTSLLCLTQEVGTSPNQPIACFFTNTDVRTKLTLGMFSVFLRYHFYRWQDWLDFYVGAGPRAFFFKAENSSKFVRNEYENALGGFVSLGLNFCMWDRVHFSSAIDYAIRSLNPQTCYASRNCLTKFNGATFSLGLGLDF